MILDETYDALVMSKPWNVEYDGFQLKIKIEQVASND